LFQDLGIEEGEQIELNTLVNLPKATYAKFQLFSDIEEKQLDVGNDRLFLEQQLVNFSTLHVGEIIPLTFPGSWETVSYIVKELRPADTVSILNVDLEVELQESEKQKEKNQEKEKEKEKEKDKKIFDLNGDEDDEDFGDDDKPETKLSSNQNTQKIQVGYKFEDSADLKNSSDECICPVCSTSLSKDTFNNHVMRCSRLNVKCSLCNKAYLRGKDQEHLEEFHSYITCPACMLKIEKVFFEKHKLEECQYRPVPCRWCHIPQSFKKLKSHEDMCGSKTDICPLCNCRIAKKYLQSHIDSGCVTSENLNDFQDDEILNHFDSQKFEMEQEQKRHEALSGKSLAEALVSDDDIFPSFL